MVHTREEITTYTHGKTNMKRAKGLSIDQLIGELASHTDSIISEFQENKLRKRDVDWEKVFHRIEALGNVYNMASDICETSQNFQCLMKVEDEHNIQKEKILRRIKDHCKQ